MNILTIDDAATDDERAALRDALAIWERDGACSAELLDLSSIAMRSGWHNRDDPPVTSPRVDKS